MLGARSVMNDASFRTKRIKNIATRSGPAPVINSESWLLTKQQGCCNSIPVCVQEECFIPGYDIPWPLVDGYYEITGILDDTTTIIFNVAQMTTNCNGTVGCAPSIIFGVDNIYPTGVTEFNDSAAACSEPISLQMPVTSYIDPISTVDISFIVGFSGNICPVGRGFEVIIKLKLTYTAVLSNEELIAAARSSADNAANRAVNAAAAAATSAAGAQVVAITAATNGNLNLTQIQSAFTAASKAYNASFAASNIAIAAAAVAATATTVGSVTTAANDAIQQAAIAESQSAIAAEQAAIARSLL